MKLVGADLAAVQAVFAQDVPVRVAKINEHLAELDAAPTPEALAGPLAALAHEVHNIRGACATIQLGVLASLSMDVEVAIEALLESRTAETAELVRVAGRLVDALEREAAAIPETRPADADDAAPTGNRTVLHIEDNLSNLKLVERVLARRPAVRLVEAQSGEKGLELARSLAPMLVLLDLRLGDMSGEEVLARLRSDPVTSGLRVVVVSAEARPAEASRLIALGADDYLVKPIEIEALLELVDGVVESVER